MKKYFASAAVIAISIGSALAADLPSRKAPQIAPPPPPPPMWTGFYGGLNIGGNVGTNSMATSSPYQVSSMVYTDIGQRPLPFPYIYYPTLSGSVVNNGGGSSMTQSGVIGGLQIGYNQQLDSRFVVGLEADFQGTGIGGNSGLSGRSSAISTPIVEPPPRIPEYFTLNGVTSQNVSANVNWLGTVRGRLGYLITPTLLAYATGGLTYGGVSGKSSLMAIQNTNLLNETDVANVEASATQVFAGFGQRQNKVLFGWNVGGGLEWMFLQNWSLKAEAIYWNLGSTNFGTSALAGNTVVNMCPGECDETVAITSGAFAGPTKVNYQGIIARAGINYHFSFGGLNSEFIRF